MTTPLPPRNSNPPLLKWPTFESFPKQILMSGPFQVPFSLKMTLYKFYICRRLKRRKYHYIYMSSPKRPTHSTTVETYQKHLLKPGSSLTHAV